MGVVSGFGFTQSPQRCKERNVARLLRSERCEKYEKVTIGNTFLFLIYTAALVSSLFTVRQILSGFSFFNSSGNNSLVQFW